ncbi:hypothetical protein DFH28DRAFT_928305 [Melampsora americana]|nr:hypothetical protein DFH28DRAFT_928305 [Melampsora americana]
MRVTYDTECYFICKKCVKIGNLEEAARICKRKSLYRSCDPCKSNKAKCEASETPYPKGHEHGFEGEMKDLKQPVAHVKKSRAKEESEEEEEELPKVDQIKGKIKMSESLGESDDDHSFERKKKKKTNPDPSNSNNQNTSSSPSPSSPSRLSPPFFSDIPCFAQYWKDYPK